MSEQSRKFQRKIENFTCLNCRLKVKGSGFTNHCPRCLFSLHVDLNPGDRAGKCLGIMRPIAVEINHNSKTLMHQCLECGQVKKNKTAGGDNFESILKIIEEQKPSNTPRLIKCHPNR